MGHNYRSLAGGADRFVVVDTETTGIYTSDRIVEIALLTLSLDGELIDSFDTLIQPQRDVSASHIHGITASMVVSAPTFADVAGDIAVRLNGACLVAHNLPFDYRMLSSEFARLGQQLTMTAGVDTLVATHCRLHEACGMFGVALDGAHRAMGDATATAELLSWVAPQCGIGSPVAAPHGLIRTGRVFRREDTAPGYLPETPLLVYLASRLPHNGVEADLLIYLELVGRAAADLHLDRAERAHLAELASGLGLSPAHVAQAHRRYVNDLVDAAISDSQVTDDEYDTLVRIAAALDVDQTTVERRVHPFMEVDTSVTLAPGMKIVFTGDHTRESLAHELGLEVQYGVSKSTQIVAAADPSSNSGKAGKARQYGIPIIAASDLERARLGDVLRAHGTGRAQLKVISCPDCHATWTVPATTAGQRTKRCVDCATIPPRTTSKRAVKDMWAPPTIEWLTCSRCGRNWHREVTKGRKPHECPSCRVSS